MDLLADYWYIFILLYVMFLLLMTAYVFGPDEILEDSIVFLCRSFEVV